jgi:hypothetical protein
LNGWLRSKATSVDCPTIGKWRAKSAPAAGGISHARNEQQNNPHFFKIARVLPVMSELVRRQAFQEIAA